MSSFFYHPHQRVWNSRNAKFFKNIGLRRVPVALDTHLLRKRARERRAKLVGDGQPTLPEGKIVYLDLGLHETASQIFAMLKWFGETGKLQVYGFEAHPGYVEHCNKLFAGDPRVRLFNYALVGPDHTGDTVALHLDAKKGGLGNSLFAARGNEAIPVPAIRLSKFIRDNAIAGPDDVIILRMNIEGAEMHVIEDLAEAGMTGAIDGYYGMWDDLSKIDPALDEKFRALLQREGIDPFTFNDRDSSKLAGPSRMDIIRYDIETSIHAGAQRKSA